MSIRRTVVSLSFFLSAAAFAAEDPLGAAQRLLAEGRAAEAHVLLQGLADTRAGEPDFDLLLGAAALHSGQPTQAVFALERVLARQPNNQDARALIGQAYLSLGEIEASRQALTEARRGDVPAPVAERIARMLGQIAEIEKDQGTRVSGYVEASLGADSNVNSATGSQTVAVPALGGAIAVLAPGAVRQDDEFLGLSAGVAVRHRLDPEWSIVARAGAGMKLNFSRDAFDNSSLEASVGAVFDREGNQYSASLQTNSLWVDNTRFRDYFGVNGQWRHTLSQSSEASAYVQHGRLSYPGQPLRDADRTVLGGAWVQALPTQWTPTVFLSAYVGEEREISANVAHLGHRLFGARAGGELTLAPKFVAFGSASWEQRDYGGQEPLFLTSRDDRQLDLQAGLRYTLPGNWVLQGALSHTENRSSVALYKFERTVLNVALRYEFR